MSLTYHGSCPPLYAAVRRRDDADGVALFNFRCSQVNATTVPIDAVVYGDANTGGLIDETGSVNDFVRDMQLRAADVEPFLGRLRQRKLEALQR